MQLWHGPIEEFVRNATCGAMAPAMVANFYKHHGYQAGTSEVVSWENSLHALGRVVEGLDAKDVGVVVEYHLPFSGQRIDAIFLGKGETGGAHGLVVELKQWSRVSVGDPFELNVVVDDHEHAHPCQQALDYAGSLTNIHSSFVEGPLSALACSYCHNLAANQAEPLIRAQFGELIRNSPLFKKGDEALLAKHVARAVGAGDGISLMENYVSGRFRPSKKLLEVLEATMKGDSKWFLIGRQREAYNYIFAEVRRLAKQKKQSAVLIRGGPGTGKSVIAVQLLADAIRLGLSAAHATGGEAFTTALRSKFAKAKQLFIGNMHTRNVATQSIDLLLVDEAHRIRKTSDMRFTPANDRNKRSQMDELLNSAKIAVFFLDENQFMRPDEIGCSDLVREETKRFGVSLKEYDLDVQFRCGGCVEYTSWLDYLLGNATDKPKPWGKMYTFGVVDSPDLLDDLLRNAQEDGERARLVAGFCWPWSNPLEDGNLIGTSLAPLPNNIPNWRS